MWCCNLLQLSVVSVSAKLEPRVDCIDCIPVFGVGRVIISYPLILWDYKTVIIYTISEGHTGSSRIRIWRRVEEYSITSYTIRVRCSITSQDVARTGRHVGISATSCTICSGLALQVQKLLKSRAELTS